MVKLEGEALTDFYHTSYKEQYHFVPIKNWNNDPNGLCWYEGRYHLFYQANPHEQKWGDMYWGHAVSKDLIHWTHLPYVFQPQQEILEQDQLKGGAFSGCAVPMEDEVIFYLTRHLGPLEDGPDTMEWQTMSRSKDMIHFEEETIVIKDKPEGVGYDFRDPKVFCNKGIWYMVLAGAFNGQSAILLYSSPDLLQWEYLGPLVVEPDPGSTTFECPDFFYLDGKYVALGALMKHTDEHGRYQMTKYYVGDFIDHKIHVESTGWFDFGSNYYAVQSFEHEGKRIAIGWVSDFYEEHVEVKNGSYGSFALPRVLSLRNDVLCMEPVPQVYDLKQEIIYQGQGESIEIDQIPGNSYYVKLDLKHSTDFIMELGRDEDRHIYLLRDHGVTKIKTVNTKTDHIDFIADVQDVKNIEVFVDRRVVEVYINHGYAVGTKLFYTPSCEGIFGVKFHEAENVEYLEIATMKSIW